MACRWPIGTGKRFRVPDGRLSLRQIYSGEADIGLHHARRIVGRARSTDLSCWRSPTAMNVWPLLGNALSFSPGMGQVASAGAP